MHIDESMLSHAVAYILSVYPSVVCIEQQIDGAYCMCWMFADSMALFSPFLIYFCLQPFSPLSAIFHLHASLTPPPGPLAGCWWLCNYAKSSKILVSGWTKNAIKILFEEFPRWQAYTLHVIWYMHSFPSKECAMKVLPNENLLVKMMLSTRINSVLFLCVFFFFFQFSRSSFL